MFYPPSRMAKFLGLLVISEVYVQQTNNGNYTNKTEAAASMGVHQPTMDF